MTTSDAQPDRPTQNAWMPMIDHEQRAREDRRARKADTAIARLAARELARWLNLDAHDTWMILTRLRALTRRGESHDEIMRRLSS